MLVSLMRRMLHRFGRRYDYDTSYMTDLADVDRSGFLKLGMAVGFTNHRFGLPPGPYFAAKITATSRADCGSCLGLVIGMAEEAGVPRPAILALLTGGQAEPEMLLAADYAKAVLDNRPELFELMEAAKGRWGERGVAGLAAATVSGLFYPTLKRGLGHGNRCEPILTELRAEARALQRLETDASGG